MDAYSDCWPASQPDSALIQEVHWRTHVLSMGWCILNERIDKMTDEERQEYQKWLRDVDAAIISVAGIGMNDIEDFAYFDAWDNGCEPKECAHDALLDAGFPSDLLVGLVDD